MRQFLFDPLNISTGVQFADAPNDYSAFAKSYYFKNLSHVEIGEDGLKIVHPIGPAGSVCMSANAMSGWLKFLLEKGGNITNSADIEETWKPRIDVPENLGKGLEYSLGYFIEKHRGNLQ